MRAAGENNSRISPNLHAVGGVNGSTDQSQDRHRRTRRILSGGLSRGNIFLLEGSPAPARPRSRCSSCSRARKAGERGLYITLSETEEELREGAASHGWTLDEAIEVFELVPPESLLDAEQQQSLLYSSDLELGETTKQIFEAVERVKPEPRRARQPVRDPPAGAELAALPPPDPGAEALFRAPRRHRPAARRPDRRSRRQDRAQRRPRRASGWRSWRPTTAPSGGACGCIKYRGQRFRGGYHDFTITTGGVQVFPRLVAAEHRTELRANSAVERHRASSTRCSAAASSAARAR